MDYRGLYFTVRIDLLFIENEFLLYSQQLIAGRLPLLMQSSMGPAFFYTKAFVNDSVAICLIMTKLLHLTN